MFLRSTKEADRYVNSSFYNDIFMRTQIK